MTESLQALLTGGWQALTGPGLMFLVAGVGVGYVVGLLPGIGGPAAMALLLPAAFSLDTVPACALLTGLAASTVTAGEITAVLLGVPGEATSAAMLADGYRLTTRGEAGRAAGAAVMASLIGGAFGAVALALAIPVARPLLAEIGSPELLMLALMGVVLMAPISAGAPLKGFVAGGIGLAAATVGLDPSEGQPRFTFNQLFLWDGVSVLSIALGLFAVPEAVRLLQTRGRDASPGPISNGPATGVRETWRRWPLVLRCSLIGTGVGILPGVGATLSQWLAYGHAARSSPRRAHFGTGEIEGVIGPSAASNATLGGDFVPTLALGIPGSLPTAIVLGALVLKGLTPGPGMLLPEADGGQLPLVFSFVWMILVGNALAAAISLVFLGRLSRVARIRPVLLFPIVMTFVPLGVYAERQAAGDLVVAALMGAVGCAMARYDWPRAPLLLGLVLGPILERRLLIATHAYGAAWIWRPGVLLLAAITAVMLYRLRPEAGPQTTKRLAGRGDVLVSLGAAVIAGAGLWASRTLVGPAAVLPRLALGSVVVLGTVQAWLLWIQRAPGRMERVDTRGVFLALGATAPFLVGPLVTGFALTSALAAAGYLRWHAREPWLRVVAVSGALALVAAAVAALSFAR